MTVTAPAKFNLTTRETVAVLGSTKLFRRLRHYGWLLPLEESRPGRSCLFPISRIELVQAQMERGMFPPLLPSERAANERRHFVSK
jgi:hypothetical protein